MTPVTEQKEGPCDFSFACADYHVKCQATYDAAKAENKDLREALSELGGSAYFDEWKKQRG